MKIKHLFLIVLLSIILIINLHRITDNHPAKTISKKYQIIDLIECEKLFNNKSYGAARACVVPLVEKYPNDTIVRFYNGITLLYSGEIEQAEAEFDYIFANENKNKKLIEATGHYLKKLNEAKRLRRHDIGHYYTDLKQTVIWENPHNIKVCIQNDYNKKELLKQAFIQWDEAVHSTVNFVFIDNCDEAQIIAKAVPRSTVISKHSPSAIGLTTSKTYYYTNIPDKVYFHKAFVEVSVNFDEKYQIDDKTFKSIALHEIGHALGISSHSPSIGDIMYYSTDSYALDKITNRDANTIKRIYGNIL